MTNLTKFIIALVGLLLMAVVVSRQLFLFAVFQSPLGFLDAKAGRNHLWLSIGASLAACISAWLMFRFFGLHEKTKWSKVEMISTGPPLTPVIHHALANPWLPEAQADDRTPMDGSVRDLGGTPSEQRSFARRTHQLMFKKWSQERHD
jgi:hypothetical protein